MAGLMLSRHHSLFLGSLRLAVLVDTRLCVHHESSVSPQHALPRAAVSFQHALPRAAGGLLVLQHCSHPLRALRVAHENARDNTATILSHVPRPKFRYIFSDPTVAQSGSSAQYLERYEPRDFRRFLVLLCCWCAAERFDEQHIFLVSGSEIMVVVRISCTFIVQILLFIFLI